MLVGWAVSYLSAGGPAEYLGDVGYPSYEQDTEVHPRRRDGGIIFLYLTFQPIYSPDSTLSGGGPAEYLGGVGIHPMGRIRSYTPGDEMGVSFSCISYISTYILAR